jgi:branched-chain amino acid transport system substrate-binding protein
MNRINFRALTNRLTRIFFVLVLVLLGNFTVPAWSGDALKIGAVLSLTGPWEYKGQHQKKALNMIKELINSHGGIKGRPLQLVFYDSEGKPAQAATAVKRLIYQDRVIGIIGPSATPSTFAVMPIAAKMKIPTIILAQDVEIDASSSTGKWIFQTAPRFNLRIRSSLLNMKRQKFSKFVFASYSSEFTDRLRDRISILADDLGMKLEHHIKYSPDSTELVIPLLQRQAPGKVVLFYDPFLPSRDPYFITRLRQWEKVKLDSVPGPFYFLDAGLNPFLYQLNLSPRFPGIMEARLVVPACLFPDRLPGNQGERKQKILDFAEQYKRTYSERTSIYPFFAHDALRLFEHVLQTAKNSDPSQIREQLASIKAFAGLVGEYNFSLNDHNGLPDEIFIADKQNDDGCNPGQSPCRDMCETQCCKEDGC